MSQDSSPRLLPREEETSHQPLLHEIKAVCLLEGPMMSMAKAIEAMLDFMIGHAKTNEDYLQVTNLYNDVLVHYLIVCGGLLNIADSTLDVTTIIKDALDKEHQDRVKKITSANLLSCDVKEDATTSCHSSNKK